MIHEVEGDILLTKAHAIAHGVAANDPMSQGLALALHQRYPAMHKDFHHWCHTTHPKSGDAWLWSGVGKGIGANARIINLLTQEGGHAGTKPGKATEGNVNNSLRALRKIVEQEGLKSLALPRLATGVGGMSWEIVRPIIVSQLGDIGIPVFVYITYHAGQQAKESGL
ncbi:MAG: macro domain-containing protein [Pseudohongiellaceae bacterium]